METAAERLFKHEQEPLLMFSQGGSDGKLHRLPTMLSLPPYTCFTVADTAQVKIFILKYTRPISLTAGLQ